MLPVDNIMLLSYINTQLRDNYESLDELCLSLDASREDICSKLASIGYHYSDESNQFI